MNLIQKPSIKLLYHKKVNSILKEKEVIFSYLYGSITQNKLSQLSDIDIAVYLKEDVNKYSRHRIRLELIGKLESIFGSKRVDLVILNDIGILLSFEIINSGIVLYQSDELKRLEFEENTIKFYLDFKPIADAYNKIQKETILSEK